MPKKKVNAKDLVTKIERMTRERMLGDGVVSLREYRTARENQNPHTLLIIEDDESMRRSMRRIFENESYRVITAADGTQLSQVLDEAHVDLIILDVGLPWINGLELAELMKEHDELKDIPLIFVSGRVSDEDVKRGFDVGADDYIKKPFEIDEIKRSVNTLMKLQQ